MSDAAAYWHRQYEALKREHVALIERTSALRAAYRDVIVAAQCVHDHAPAGTVGLAALCAALGAAPEAAP